MQKLKQYVEKGQVQIAKLDQNNKPSKMYDILIRRDYSQLENKVKFKNKMSSIAQSLKQLTLKEKHEWSNFKRLRANRLYLQGQLDKAINLYLQSLIGLDFSNMPSAQVKQLKEDLLYPTLLNMATCYYKKKIILQINRIM